MPCEYCGGIMTKVDGCINRIYLLNNGKEVNAVRAGADGWVEEDGKCFDCGAKDGHFHHLGCDGERCRLCGGQFIACDCDYSDQMVIVNQRAKGLN